MSRQYFGLGLLHLMWETSHCRSNLIRGSQSHGTKDLRLDHCTTQVKAIVEAVHIINYNS